MGLTLYKVIGTHNRVALGAMADGVEYYTAVQRDDKVIVLTPVTIVGATATDAPNGADSGQEEPRDTSPGY